jgi:DNA-directed RNA polymerase beta' subunit
MSHGEIKEPLMLSSKNLSPEKGGLYDPVITGGIKGTQWSHYRLPESIPSPLFERPIKSILGLSTKEFEGIAHGKIGVTKGDRDVFHLHDVETGKKLRSVQVNSLKARPELEDVVEVEKEDD